MKCWISFHSGTVFGLLFSLTQMPLFGRRIRSPAKPSSSRFWQDSTQKRRRMRARRVFSSICAKRWPMDYSAAKKVLLSGWSSHCCTCVFLVIPPRNTGQQGPCACLGNRIKWAKNRGHMDTTETSASLRMRHLTFLGQPIAHLSSHSTQYSNIEGEIFNSLHGLNTKHSLVMSLGWTKQGRMDDRWGQQKMQHTDSRKR